VLGEFVLDRGSRIFWVVTGRFVDRHASLSLRDIYCINQRLGLPQSTGDRSSVDRRVDRLLPARRGTVAGLPIHGTTTTRTASSWS